MNKDAQRIYESYVNIHGILQEQMVPQGMCYIEDPETGAVQELARGELMDYIKNTPTLVLLAYHPNDRAVLEVDPDFIEGMRMRFKAENGEPAQDDSQLADTIAEFFMNADTLIPGYL